MEKVSINHFKLKYGEPEFIVFSPGRANIIGEHTDYNQGLVLPFAINLGITFLCRRNNANSIRINALDINDKTTINRQPSEFLKDGWTRYFNNALLALNKGIISGMDISFGGNLPQGAGASSSSALTCGFLYLLNKVWNLKLPLSTITSLASQAENGIGLKGGMMDQTAILFGKANNALLIDFLTSEKTPIPINLGPHHFYLIKSGQSHDLVSTEYNERRATCEAALDIITLECPSVKNIRDIKSQHLDNKNLSKTMQKRMRHVISENRRVEKAIEAISNNNFIQLGALITETHNSLSKNYEVSTPEIDFLVNLLNQQPNVLGARIMGGGFGGSLLCLVNNLFNKDHFNQIKDEYFKNSSLKASLVPIEIYDGTKILSGI